MIVYFNNLINKYPFVVQNNKKQRSLVLYFHKGKLHSGACFASLIVKFPYKLHIENLREYLIILTALQALSYTFSEKTLTTKMKFNQNIAELFILKDIKLFRKCIF